MEFENEFLDIESVSDELEPEPAEIISESESSGEEAEIFRVFRTQEEFQSCLDRALGKRLEKHRQQSDELCRLKPLVSKALKRLSLASIEELEALEDAPDTNSDSSLELSAESLTNELSGLALQNSEVYLPEQAESLLADKRFISLVKSGFSVKEAYDAVNSVLVKDNIKKAAREELLRDIRLKKLQPTEDATRGYGSFSAALDPKNLSDAQRADIRERVRRGERITF